MNTLDDITARVYREQADAYMGMARAGMDMDMANLGMLGTYASQAGLANSCQPKVPTPAWYRGVFTDGDIEDLRRRTRSRQAVAYANLKAAGKSVLNR